jgi:ubiquinol-cytochrome c reductase cytochrome c1 subunit
MLPGLHYNPYFPGGAIAMAKQLVDGQVEYEDGACEQFFLYDKVKCIISSPVQLGTPATETQMAKDVAAFLAWVAEPEHDERKKSGMQWVVAIVAALAITGMFY